MNKTANAVFGISLAALGIGAPLVASAQIEGFTQPARTVEVATPESGLVAVLKVDEGAIVQKGQVIAVLDSKLITASMDVAKARKSANASIESAQARYEQAKTRRSRVEELSRRGSARPDELIRAKADAAIAVAELKGARESQQIAELEYERLMTQIERRTIRSPISGVVTRIVREQGELVHASQPVIAEIAELDRLHVVSHIPEARARTLRKGSELRVKLASGEGVTGVIGFIAPMVDPRSATVEVKVLLNNPKGEIRSGMRASLAIAGSRSADEGQLSESAVAPGLTDDDLAVTSQ